MLEPALLQKLVIVGIILLVTGVAAWLLSRFLKSGSIQGMIGRSRSKLDDKLLNSIRFPVIYAVILIGVWLALQEADFLIDPDSETIQTIFFILFLSLGYLAAVRVMTGLIDWYRIEVASKTETTLDDHVLPFFGV
jgi:MscS family membrane protein